MSLQHTTKELAILCQLEDYLVSLANSQKQKDDHAIKWNRWMINAWANAYQQERLNQLLRSRPMRRLIHYIKTGR